MIGGIFIPIFKKKERSKILIITGMAHFQSVCKKKMVEWYNKNGYAVTPTTPPIDLSNVLWCGLVKLQNYKCLVSTTVRRYGIYASIPITVISRSCTRMYTKAVNTCFTEE